MEHDTPEAAHIGVDVSKGWLDAHELPSGRSRRFENSGKGYREFRAWVGAGPVGLVLFEATGPYDQAFHAALGGELPLCRVNAAWARHFRKSLGWEAKTDRVDAALLAAMARLRRDLRATPVRPESFRALEALWAARDALSRDRGRLKARSEQEDWQPYLRRRNAARLRWMDKELAGMDAETGRLLALDPGLSRRVEVLSSISGIGPAVALALAVGMPELGAIGGREAASLAGVAPFANDSGAHRGKRSIRGGRGRPRRKLFMAATGAARHNPEMRRVYEGMLARGKPKKVSLVAVMRRLVVLANTLLREDRLWTPAPPNAGAAVQQPA
ncbi:MAG: transposase [Gammaproteobacteria bacterium]|nr:transposase [Gammaproteobacteria bacterium]